MADKNKIEYWFTYENEERFQHGGFATFDEAKNVLFNMHKSNLSERESIENLPTESTIGEMVHPSVAAKRHIPTLLETVKEQIIESLIFDFGTEDEPCSFDADDDKLITDMLHKLFDADRWHYVGVATNCTIVNLSNIKTDTAEFDSWDDLPF